MKRLLLSMLIAISMLMTVGAASAADDSCYWNASTEVNLIAGQDTDIGSVTVEIVGDNLLVTYYAEGDWLLYETQLNVSKVPITSAVPGLYPYKHDLSGVSTDQYIIPLSDFGMSNPCYCDGDCTDALYIAAHAGVDDDDDYEEHETAWGEGQDIGGNWAMYFEVDLTCECGGIIITEVPEFPTVALPIAAILGLAFFFQRRKE